MKNLILFISEGFGIGRSPIAPGTCGSLLGVLWFFLLALTRNFYLYFFGAALGVFVSIYFCDVAEKMLKEKDPSRVVLDEIVAVPICYSGWLLLISSSALPPPIYFLSGKKWLAFVGIFVTFRLLDAIKPFPIGVTQRLGGGVGVVADDVVAGVLTALIWIILLRQFPAFFGME